MAEQARSTLTRHDLEAKIVKRWENKDFRKEFTGDPTGTAAKYLQTPADKLPKIVIHEEPTGSWYIVVPPRPANISGLSELELEKVAGGKSYEYTISLAVTAITGVLSGGAAAGSAYVSAKYDPGW
jgi:hypothetical protein